jgi:hypothetical protein
VIHDAKSLHLKATCIIDLIYLPLKPSIHVFFTDSRSIQYARFNEEDEIDNRVEFRIVSLTQVHPFSLSLVSRLNNITF